MRYTYLLATCLLTQSCSLAPGRRLAPKHLDDFNESGTAVFISLAYDADDAQGAWSERTQQLVGGTLRTALTLASMSRLLVAEAWPVVSTTNGGSRALPGMPSSEALLSAHLAEFNASTRVLAILLGDPQITQYDAVRERWQAHVDRLFGIDSDTAPALKITWVAGLETFLRRAGSLNFLWPRPPRRLHPHMQIETPMYWPTARDDGGEGIWHWLEAFALQSERTDVAPSLPNLFRVLAPSRGHFRVLPRQSAAEPQWRAFEPEMLPDGAEGPLFEFPGAVTGTARIIEGTLAEDNTAPAALTDKVFDAPTLPPDLQRGRRYLAIASHAPR